MKLKLKERHPAQIVFMILLVVGEISLIIWKPFDKDFRTILHVGLPLIFFALLAWGVSGKFAKVVLSEEQKDKVRGNGLNSITRLINPDTHNVFTEYVVDVPVVLEDGTKKMLQIGEEHFAFLSEPNNLQHLLDDNIEVVFENEYPFEVFTVRVATNTPRYSGPTQIMGGFH